MTETYYIPSPEEIQRVQRVANTCAELIDTLTVHEQGAVLTMLVSAWEEETGMALNGYEQLHTSERQG